MAKEKNVTPAVTTTTPVVNETPATPETTPAPAAVVEPENDKIIELRGKQKDAILLSRTFEPLSKEESDARLQAWNFGQEIIAEIANIKREKAESDKKEAQAEKVKMVHAVIDTANVAASNPTEENKDAAKKAFDAVANILLGAVKSTPATGKTKTANGEGSKGATTAAIRVCIARNREAGMNDTENNKNLIEVEGFARGTVWGILDAYKKEFGAKP